MKAQGYRIAESRRLVGVPPEGLLAEWGGGGADYWLDIQGSCHEALEHYLGAVEIDPILRRRCDEDTEEIARVFPAEGAIFFGLPVSTGVEVDDEPVGYLRALCLPRLVITLHAQPLPSLQQIAEMLESTAVLVAPTTSALVCGMLVRLSSSSIEEAQRTRRRIGALAEQMDRDADSVEIKQLLAERAALRRLESLEDESTPVYAMLKVTNNDQLNLAGLEVYYQIVLSNAAFLNRIVDRLDTRLDDLHQRFVINAQDKTNQRLALLTVISAIFLPLTLLAGIYGMNFEDMPELGLPYAYPTALVVMVAIAFGMWRFFKRNGWFD
jgi:magnesium transporter